jgi:hypothetical protein
VELVEVFQQIQTVVAVVVLVVLEHLQVHLVAVHPQSQNLHYQLLIHTQLLLVLVEQVWQVHLVIKELLLLYQAQD